MPNESDVMVSVICLTYNHEKFIRNTLEGFIMQKTDFPFEVFVHDDASTDNTAAIIREYAEKYPNIIKPIYQKENQYSKHKGIVKNYIYPLMKGKYIAWCEGDDFWADSNKLQMQVEILSENRDCIACFSRVAIVDYFGEMTGRYIPEFNRNDFIFDKDSYFKYCLYPSKIRNLPFQISGLMVKRETYADYITNPPPFRSGFEVGDIPLFLFLGLVGNIYYLSKITSNYRVGNPNSWVGQNKGNLSIMKKHMESENKGLILFDNYTEQKYHSFVEKGVNRRKFLVYQKEHNIKKMRQPEMKEFYQTLSKQRIITHYIAHYFPGMANFLKKLLNRDG